MRITEMRTQESRPSKDDKRNDYHRSTNKELVYVVKIFHVSIPHIQVVAVAPLELSILM